MVSKTYSCCSLRCSILLQQQASLHSLLSTAHAVFGRSINQDCTALMPLLLVVLGCGWYRSRL